MRRLARRCAEAGRETTTMQLMKVAVQLCERVDGVPRCDMTWRVESMTCDYIAFTMRSRA